MSDAAANVFEKHKHLRMTKLREMVRSYGPKFSHVRARTKLDLCNRLQDALRTGDTPPAQLAVAASPITTAVEEKGGGGKEGGGEKGGWLQMPLVDVRGRENGKRMAVRYPMVDEPEESVEVALRGRGWGHTGDVKTVSDELDAEKQNISLLFGEILPEGLGKMMDHSHLDVSNANVLIDLGSGLGKLALQSFLSYPQLSHVAGIELCASRFLEACSTATRLAKSNPHLLYCPSYSCPSSSSTRLDLRTGGGGGSNAANSRLLQFYRGDLLEFGWLVKTADVVICQTDLPSKRQKELVSLLSEMKPGARLLLYHSLLQLPGVTRPSPSLDGDLVAQFPDRSLWLSMSPHDCRIPTSWSKSLGHKFDFWKKLD